MSGPLFDRDSSEYGRPETGAWVHDVSHWARETPAVLRGDTLARVHGAGVVLLIVATSDALDGFVLCADGGGPVELFCPIVFERFDAAWAVLDAALRDSSPELFS